MDTTKYKQDVKPAFQDVTLLQMILLIAPFANCTFKKTSVENLALKTQTPLIKVSTTGSFPYICEFTMYSGQCIPSQNHMSFTHVRVVIFQNKVVIFPKKCSAFSECIYCRGTGRNVCLMESYLFNEVYLLRAKRQNSGN